MTSSPANERSRNSTLSTSQPQPQPPANLSKEDADDWLAIDKLLSRIQSVNPSDPYVLTIPQHVEPRYHHQRPEHRTQWRDHAPFYEHEHEASQYLTWHFHDPNDIYVLHSTRKEDGGSRIGTPKAGTGGPKKTMSLGAYKKKVAAGTPGPEERKKAEVNGEMEAAEEKKAEAENALKKAAVKGPVERIKADEEVLAAVEDGDDIVPQVIDEKKTAEAGKQDMKRKRVWEEQETAQSAKRKREDSKISADREEKDLDVGKAGSEKLKHEDAVRPAAKEKELSAIKPDPTSLPNSDDARLAAKNARSADATDKAPVDKARKDTHAPSSLQQQPTTSLKKTSTPPTNTDAKPDDITLPPRLSPLREEDRPSTEDSTALLLPPRLSPTLPANIADSLAAREHYKSTSQSAAVGDTLTPPRKTLENSITKRKSPVNGFRANSSSPMVRSDVEDARGRPKTSAPPLRSVSTSGEESEIAVGRAAAVTKKEKASRLIVKLKFKHRTTREAVKQLLKSSPAKKKPEPKSSPVALKATDARHREQRDTNAKGVAQKVGPATKGVAKQVGKTLTAKSSEKPAREEESEAGGRAAKRKTADTAVYEPPAKRKKSVSESLDVDNSVPHTPSQPTPQPSTPASTVRRPASQPTSSSAAPRKAGKELLAAATTSAGLKREPSHDSQGQAPTPSAASSSPAASSTSQAQASAVPKSTPTSAIPPTPASAQPKTTRQKEWEAQHQRFNSLGRDLKRAATADLNTVSENKALPATEIETLKRVAAVKALESLLAYFLAFTSCDEALSTVEPRQPLRTTPWRTLQDYFPFVKRYTEPFPALQGLACMLAVVFCARIVEACAGQKEGREEVLAQAWAVLTRSAAVAETKLDVVTLRETFPKAWALGTDASAGAGGSGEEKLEPGKFAGAFRLPIGVQTKPVRAVRAARAMIGEWVEKEGVEYEIRIQLE